MSFMNTAMLLSVFDFFIKAAPLIIVGGLLFGAIEKNGCSNVAAWIIGFVGLVVFAIVLDSSVAFFVAVGIFTAIYVAYSIFSMKKGKEDSNHGSAEIIGNGQAACDDVPDEDDIDEDESLDDDSEGEMVDDDDHYCPVCGSSLLYVKENEYGNRRYHCCDCDGDFRECELLILSECSCPECGGGDLYAFEDLDCENKFVCRDCHNKFDVDEMVEMMK